MPTELKQGDTAQDIEAELTNPDGSPIDLSESDTVRFRMAHYPDEQGASPTLVVNSTDVQVDYPNSTVTYDLTQGDTELLGEHQGEFVITYADTGETEIYPQGNSYIMMQVYEPVDSSGDLPSEPDVDIEVASVTADSAAIGDLTTQQASVATAPAAPEDAARQADITTHTGDASAHHAKTTSGDIDHADVSNVQSDQHHTKTNRYTSEEVRDTVAGFLASAGSVGLTHDDANDTLTISADENTDTQLSGEQVRSIVAGFVTGGSNVSLTHDDAGDALTITATDTNTQLSAQDVIDAVGGEAINPDTIGANTPASSINTEQITVNDQPSDLHWERVEKVDGQDQPEFSLPSSGGANSGNYEYLVRYEIRCSNSGSAELRINDGSETFGGWLQDGSTVSGTTIPLVTNTTGGNEMVIAGVLLVSPWLGSYLSIDHRGGPARVGRTNEWLDRAGYEGSLNTLTFVGTQGFGGISYAILYRRPIVNKA